jgi:hypothetical protein
MNTRVASIMCGVCCGGGGGGGGGVCVCVCGRQLRESQDHSFISQNKNKILTIRWLT